MTDGYQAPRCATCGHTGADHNSGRRTLAGALMGGTRWPGMCLISSCDCRQFIPEPEESDRAAA